MLNLSASKSTVYLLIALSLVLVSLTSVNLVLANAESTKTVVITTPPPSNFVEAFKIVEHYRDKHLIEKLKEALYLLKHGDTNDFNNVLNEIYNEVNNIGKQENNEQYKLIVLAIIILAIPTTYYLLPYIWLKLNRNKIVKLKTSNKTHHGEEYSVVLGLIIGATIILSIFIIVQVFYPPRFQGFDELALVDENGRLLVIKEPLEIISGDKLSLNIYLGNMRDIPRLYMIKTLVEYQFNTSKPRLKEYNNYYTLLAPHESTILNVSIPIESEGLHKVIVKLYAYNTSLNEYTYTNAFVQVLVLSRPIIPSR